MSWPGGLTPAAAGRLRKSTSHEGGWPCFWQHGSTPPLHAPRHASSTCRRKRRRHETLPSQGQHCLPHTAAWMEEHLKNKVKSASILFLLPLVCLGGEEHASPLTFSSVSLSISRNYLTNTTYTLRRREEAYRRNLWNGAAWGIRLRLERSRLCCLCLWLPERRHGAGTHLLAIAYLPPFPPSKKSSEAVSVLLCLPPGHGWMVDIAWPHPPKGKLPVMHSTLAQEASHLTHRASHLSLVGEWRNRQWVVQWVGTCTCNL